MKIYTPFVSNEHLSILPYDADEWIVKSSQLNINPVLGNWGRVDFGLKGFNKSGKKKPIITLLRGALAFRKDLESIIVQEKCAQIELLPIMVSGEKWFILNCLFSTDRYDASRSVLFRRSNGEVYMINYVCLLGKR